AQQVVITDQLDPTKVDLSTLRLGAVAFGTRVVTPPANATSFTRQVDLRPAQDLLVDIQGSLDASSGVLRWTFRSLDPVTGLPPADPDLGFLPPNTSAVVPAGAGSVVFSVMPRTALPTGTTISNQATIVFDANAPIPTPVWTNTIGRYALTLS